MRILVLGRGGMLGSQVVKVLSANEEFEVLSTDRWSFNPLVEGFIDLPDADYIINCIGVIKPMMSRNIENAIRVNAVFPHQLAHDCSNKMSWYAGTKLIHITTDCVYSGRVQSDGMRNFYVETDPHDALDNYGKSKSLGEPSNCMVLRASIIGPETRNYRSLISWFLSQKDTCAGFTNHFWNGITTKEYAKICEKIILNDWYEENLYHLFSTVATKFDLLGLLKQKFDKKIEINPVAADIAVDRTLDTVKVLNKKLQIPTLEAMIDEM